MSERRQPPWWSWPLLVVVVAVVVPVALAVAALWLAAALLLQLVIWATWCPRGQYALLVYSDSPIWREYFEAQVLPALGTRAVVLNWSERKRWDLSLPVMLFRVFAGGREYNPMAIVFRPFAWPRRFRFYRAFRAFKHGRPEEVENIRRELFELLDRLAPSQSP